MKNHLSFALGRRSLSISAKFTMMVLLLLAALILSSSSSVRLSSATRTTRRVACVTNILAKKLTGLLAHQDIRDHLRKEINQSSKRENILFLDEFLTSAVNISGLPDKVRSKVSKALNKAKVVKKLFSKPIFKQFLVSPEIDIYFPVQNHRNTWTGNDDLLIGIGTPNEAAKEIKAYSVKTGRIRMLDTIAPPAEPVLMLSPCEHQAHDKPPILETIDIPVEELTPDKSERGYIQTNYFRISTTSEPWYKGDPEIYVLVAQYSSTAHLQTVKKYLPGVNDPGVWKHLRGCPTALSFYWDGTYNVITFYQVMEEDTGYITDLSVEAFGVTVKFPIRDDDDDFGSVNVNRSAVGWCSYGAVTNCCNSWKTSANTGKAQMRLLLAKVQ